MDQEHAREWPAQWARVPLPLEAIERVSMACVGVSSCAFGARRRHDGPRPTRLFQRDPLGVAAFLGVEQGMRELFRATSAVRRCQPAARGGRPTPLAGCLSLGVNSSYHLAPMDSAPSWTELTRLAHSPIPSAIVRSRTVGLSAPF